MRFKILALLLAALPHLAVAEDSPLRGINGEDVAFLTKNGGLAMAHKKGRTFLSTANGRYIVRGEYELYDRINKKVIRSFSDAKESVETFNFWNSEVLVVDAIQKLGRGSQQFLVVASPYSSLEEIKALYSTMSSSITKSVYFLPTVHAGAHANEFVGAALFVCDKNKVLESGFPKEVKQDSVCKAGIQGVGASYAVSLAHEFNLDEKSLPVVVLPNGKKVFGEKNFVSLINSFGE